MGPRDKAKSCWWIRSMWVTTLLFFIYLGEFDGVSINMAKTKCLRLISIRFLVHCGRLMCCLKYEDEAYKELKSNVSLKLDQRLNMKIKL
ncbi:MAG: hypothetical protein ACLTAI_13785 [Thomasclavelia sp.]